MSARNENENKLFHELEETKLHRDETSAKYNALVGALSMYRKKWRAEGAAEALKKIQSTKNHNIGSEISRKQSEASTAEAHLICCRSLTGVYDF